MKKFDINNFVIDDVFKAIDKKYKKKNKLKDNNKKNIKEKKEECFTIDIVV